MTQRAIAGGSLIVAGLVGIFVSYGVKQIGLVGSGINYGLIIAVIGGLLSTFLIGIALYLLFKGTKFFDLPSSLLLGSFVAVVLLLLESAIYISLVLIQISFRSLQSLQ